MSSDRLLISRPSTCCELSSWLFTLIGNSHATYCQTIWRFEESWRSAKLNWSLNIFLVQRDFYNLKKSPTYASIFVLRVDLKCPLRVFKACLHFWSSPIFCLLKISVWIQHLKSLSSRCFLLTSSSKYFWSKMSIFTLSHNYYDTKETESQGGYGSNELNFLFENYPEITLPILFVKISAKCRHSINML